MKINFRFPDPENPQLDTSFSVLGHKLTILCSFLRFGIMAASATTTLSTLTWQKCLFYVFRTC